MNASRTCPYNPGTMSEPAASFPAGEREALLALKGVGPTVLARLEQMGITSLGQLAAVDASHVLAAGAALAGSSCWKNSPQARAAIEAAIQLAREGNTDS